MRYLGFNRALAAALSLGLFLAPGLSAQEAREVRVDVIRPADRSEFAPLDVSDRQSLFDLNAFGDEAAAGIRSAGPNTWCVQNITAFASRNNVGCNTGLYTTVGGIRYPQWFDVGMKWAAPASDMPDVIDPAVVVGEGYTVNMTTLIISGSVRGGGDKLWASDRSAAQLLNLGVMGTEDGACTDHTSDRAGNMDAGFQLTPTSDCPPTHPPGGWGGRHPVEAESYLQLQQTDPAFAPSVDNDPFAFWRVPEDLQRTDKFFGDWQTYGELTDWWLEALGRYGSVVPGGTSDPIYEGWPLGLTMFYDAFYFGLPSVANAQFLQATIVNESEKVYGVGFEYDSVYIGVNYDPLTCTTSTESCPQADAHFVDPDRNALTFYDTGDGCLNAPPSPSGCGERGFPAGAIPSGFVVLKSPIGDMRYELFNDPASDFFDPGHPRAGDTITFQHQRQCGFGDCLQNTWSRSQRAHFGEFASIGRNVLDGRTPGDLTEDAYWLVFRSEFWPDRTGEFNKYVPGVDDSNPVWDWNHDGQPDTIYADACGTRGCVDMWGDTLPGGHANQYGNISDFSVGPVHMAPGDTVAWVVAVVSAPDSASMESTINSAIDFYKGFYLGPEAAPAPTITAVDVVPGQGRDQNEITLFFDDAPEEWEDPFLAGLDVSADLGLNPFLDDSIAARVTDNVKALHIFKSCDGGESFTSNAGDCDGDPIEDPDSKWGDFGWRPYTTIQAGPGGTFPNTFTDEDITPGVTYTYSIVTETRGAEFNLVRLSAGNQTAELVEFAPSLLGALTTSSTSSNVAVAYAPLNLAAGSDRAQMDTVRQTGRFSVPVDVSVIGTAPRGGRYRVLFADSIRVVQVESLDQSGDVVGTQTAVTAEVLRTVTDMNGDPARAVIDSFEFDGSGSISLNGFSRDSVPVTATERSTFSSAGFGLVVAQGARPLMASTVLDGVGTTPGSFLGQESFPFFVVNVDESLGGSLDTEVFVDAVGEDVPARVSPSVNWLEARSEATGASQFGTLEIAWGDGAFGGSPFEVRSPTLAEDVRGALSARATAGQSSADAALLDVIEADDPGASLPDELAPFDLPFTVRNATFGRDVQVVVTSHQDSIVVGQGSDTLRIEVPSGVWVPGDVMYFIETVTREVTDTNGNTVLGADGQPQTETIPAATFSAVLGCGTPRSSCDPTVGGADESGYVDADPKMVLRVDFLVPIAGGDDLVFEVTPAVTTADLDPEGRYDLDGVHVVPNPYIFANKFERATDQRVLRFTNLPPEGRIRIFDLAGRFVQEINYAPEDLRGGDLDWNLQTRENLTLAAGLYVFVLETTAGDRKMGKFVVIR